MTDLAEAYAVEAVSVNKSSCCTAFNTAYLSLTINISAVVTQLVYIEIEISLHRAVIFTGIS